VSQTRAGVIGLTPETGFVGHDGRADGRPGEYAGSGAVLKDYLQIEGLAGLDKVGRRGRLHAPGDGAAAHFRDLLPEVLRRFPRLIVPTHVPPFREACWHGAGSRTTTGRPGSRAGLSGRSYARRRPRDRSA